MKRWRVVILITALLAPGLGVSAGAMADMTEFERRCHEEVVALHVVIADWLAGRVSDSDDAYRRFSEAMAEDFEIISPAGTHTDRDGIVASLRGAHGVQQASFSIAIKNIRTRMLRPPLALLTYEEWQTEGDRTTARLSSVLLRDEPSAPGGVTWVHLHETWLP